MNANSPVDPAILAQLSALSMPPLASNYDHFLRTALNPPHKPMLSSFITFLYSDVLALPAARDLHINFIHSLLLLPPDAFDLLSAHILSEHSASARSFAFEPSLIPLRTKLSDRFEQREEWELAADALTKMPFDTLATMPANILLRTNMRIASLAVRVPKLDMAEAYLNRASMLLHDAPDQLRQDHRRIHARILYLRAKFEDAASKYLHLSYEDPEALVHAGVCAILAPAGPRRSRLLASLYANERLRRLDIFPLMENVHMGRLLSPQHVDNFRTILEDGLPEGVLDRAVIEHNLAAATRLYTNVKFVELANLLGVTPERAERVAAGMIYEKRMNATIDQVEGVLKAETIDPIERWDAYIANLCSSVDDAVEAIVHKFPQFASHLQT